MPRPCVVATTYARPDGLGRLLDDLEREAPPGGLDVRVYDDATPNPDAAIAARIAAQGWRLRRADENHGKRGWWRWWNTILADLEADPPELVYVLQDDVRLCERFFDRSAALWDGIGRRERTSLVLHVDESRGALGSRCWTPVAAEPEGEVVHSGWIDLHAVMCARAVFDAIGWRLEPVGEQRWDRDPARSSGVGQQLSVRAHAHGLRMYRAAGSLTVNDESPSLMNAEARERWPMSTVGFVDGENAARRLRARRPPVFASLASIPRRERGLRDVVRALLAQVDGLGVYLNGYDRVPRFLADERVEVVRSQDAGDRGDAGKFHRAGGLQGYHLLCDDDLAYPGDYVSRLVGGIERHGRRAVVGFHGRVMQPEVRDYHGSCRVLHFARALARDTQVHVLGTGVAGYHTAAIRVTPEDFPEPNMADVWFALLGQRQRVPFVCLERDAGWLGELPGLGADSIYARARRRPTRAPSPETSAMRSHGAWQLHGAPGARRPRSPDRAIAASIRATPLRRLVRVNVSGPRSTATLVLPERDHITVAVQRSGTYYERDLLDAIHARGLTGTYVDVGAHFGNHSAFFALECGADRVVAIEPDPLAHAGLLETVAENGLRARVTTHRVAVHPTWRRVATAAAPWHPPPGSRVRTNSGRVIVRPAAGEAATPAAPLDELLEGVPDVALVKVDAEGLSAEILASGARVLLRDRPLVAAEATAGAKHGELRALLSSLGYRELAPSFCWTPTWLWEPA